MQRYGKSFLNFNDTYLKISKKNDTSLISHFKLGYTREELAMYRPAVFGNAIQGLIIILRAMVKLNINFVQAERLQDVREFFSIVAV